MNKKIKYEVRQKKYNDTRKNKSDLEIKLKYIQIKIKGKTEINKKRNSRLKLKRLENKYGRKIRLHRG